MPVRPSPMPDRATLPIKPTETRLRVGWILVPIICGLPMAASAQEAATAHLSAVGTPLGWTVVALFALSCLLVALEEHIHVRKSKPVMLAAALIWGMIAWSVRADPQRSALVSSAFERMFLDYAELFFFLVVSMTYVDAMVERGVFEVLRAWLVRRGWSYRTLFWASGLLAFALSSVLNNLTTALVVSTVVLAMGAGNARFVAMCCVNLVVAANAGGAWSAFGDITTLMVWQSHHADFFDFFRLFMPALANWLVPAALMSFALPHGKPATGDDKAALKFGGTAICTLFALTIAVTVIATQVLKLPPVFGMLAGLALLQLLAWVIRLREPSYEEPEAYPNQSGYDIFHIIARAEWDTLLFFYGVLLSVGGLATLGYLDLASRQMFNHLGPTAANTILGMASAIIDNIPIMSAVLQMHPTMDHAQWLLITLTCGVGGSLLSIGSAAGIALMGAARGQYTFTSHLRWSWAIALGFVASVLVHLSLNFPHGIRP
ncbi:MAG TPA: sodium:proton antiporter NhaD [Xanthomonadaceae bacterium]|nr:sodium:proton antiporter NhaD [Xanthomonadaceae bacterium]